MFEGQNGQTNQGYGKFQDMKKSRTQTNPGHRQFKDRDKSIGLVTSDAKLQLVSISPLVLAVLVLVIFFLQYILTNSS